MSNFLKLTLSCNCDEKHTIYLNMDRVESMFRDHVDAEDASSEEDEEVEGKDFTVLQMISTGMEDKDDSPVIFVEEEPEEILRMLQENRK